MKNKTNFRVTFAFVTVLLFGIAVFLGARWFRGRVVVTVTVVGIPLPRVGKPVMARWR